MLRRITLLIVMLSIGSVLMTGCGDDDNTDEAKSFSVGTAGPGGTYYVWGAGWSGVAGEALEKPMSVEVTGGAVDNVRLVDSGELDFSLTTTGMAYEGINGEGWADTKHENIRGIFPMYPSYMQFWLNKDLPIETIYDMEGYTLNPGPTGGTPDIFGKRIVEDFNIDVGSITNVSYADGNSLMGDGQVDIQFAAAGIPHPSASELNAVGKAKIMGIEEEQQDVLIENYPYLIKADIPSDTYDDQDEPIPTLTLWNVMLANKDLSEDLIYEITKATFEEVETLITAHQSAENVLLENVNNITSIPLHPGAIKYYEEQGIELPDEAYPPEY